MSHCPSNVPAPATCGSWSFPDVTGIHDTSNCVSLGVSLLFLFCICADLLHTGCKRERRCRQCPRAQAAHREYRGHEGMKYKMRVAGEPYTPSFLGHIKLSQTLSHPVTATTIVNDGGVLGLWLNPYQTPSHTLTLDSILHSGSFTVITTVTCWRFVGNHGS